ncbi:MAG: C10 family peptidase [Bacteroidaceae bacterium]|nr:C10 family peptidase [Bacteroidaceae bacterium]
MKKIILISITAFVLFSCTDAMQEYAAIDDQNNCVQMESGDSHFVSKSDIAALLRAQSNSTRAASDCEDDIICFEDDKHDTLLYACNKADGGWIVYASDTRVPAIIAESPSGTFSEAMENEAAYVWLQTIAEDIKVIKSLSDDKLNFSAEEIENNKKFWKSISSPDEYVKEKLAKEGFNETRGHPLLPTGHYELVSTTSFWGQSLPIPRMTTTDWHQNAPFNNYCPYKSDNSWDHAPAGCNAIAAAQMLYFLHNKFGVPATAPSQAYVFGHVGDPDYNWSQYNYTSTIWNDMRLDASYAAPLIADVGRRVQMSYGNNSSGSHAFFLPTTVFEPYGISCNYLHNINYNVDSLKMSLKRDSIPVILIARASLDTTTVGHAFIADRYKCSGYITRHTYQWVWDVIPPGSMIPMYPDNVEDDVTLAEINMIGMNWGWGSFYNNGEFYTLTGDWINHNDIDLLNWNINREMICNFKVMNN